MPKLSLELKDFSAGLMSNGDEADIPDGAASDSLNISPMGQLGAANAILDDNELMKNVPAITNMIVRDDLDGNANNLAVNIREHFIYIPDFTSDTKLADFVDIVDLGQLITNADPATYIHASSPASSWPSDGNFLGKWNSVAHDGCPHMWTVIPTEPNYVYEFSAYISTSIAAGTAHTASTGPRVLVMPYNTSRTYNSSDVILQDAYTSTTLNDVFIGGAGDSQSSFQYLVNNTKAMNFVASTDYTVIIIKGAPTASYTTTVREPRAQFSKGGYIWKQLGEDLDFTNTDKGLFIGSDTSKPHIVNRMKDDEDITLSFIEKSECVPPISATSLTNIDFMELIPAKEADTENVKLLISGIYSEPNLWAMASNWSTPASAGGVNYTNFFKSDDISFLPNGAGGMVPISATDSDAREFYIWGFEDWNFYKVALPTNCTSKMSSGSPSVKEAQTSAWTLELKQSYSLAFDVVPDGAYISKIIESKNRAGILYCLLSKEGGFGCGDTCILELDIGNYSDMLQEGAGAKPIYVILDYQTITAYNDYKYKKNWLGVRTDVNPKSSETLYWPKISQSDAKPPKYKNGDYAELVFHDSVSSVTDACWVNTKKKDVKLDVAENSLTCSTIMDSSTAQDLISFSVSPLGKTKFLRKTAKWRKAEQFPNNWPNGDSGDGWWTDIKSSQKMDLQQAH